MRGSRRYWTVGFRVESVFGASKNRKSENAQNRILDVRNVGQKVLKTTPGHPGTLVIGFALKTMPKSGLRSSKRWTDDLKTTILAFSSDH